MKNTKKIINTSMALMIALFVPINITAMFNPNNQPQTPTDQPKTFSYDGFGNRSQSQQPKPASTLNFGNSSQPQQPTIAPFGSKFGQPQQQPSTGSFSFQPQTTTTFGQPSQPQQQQPSTGSFSFQPQLPKPASPLNFGNKSQPQAPVSTFGQSSQPQQQPSTGPFSFGNPSQPQVKTTTSGSIPSQPINPPIQVYFTPQDQIQITNTLFDLLNNAKKQILIAVYWITDNAVMEKIIAAKQRNVDIQVVIDESSLEYMNITPQLLQNGIVPIIYPSSNFNAAGKMHHKFVQVDGAIVLTGSANFTKTVLDAKKLGFNFENVVVIHSTDIARQYSDAFTQMKKDIFDFYVQIIALTTPYNLPNWISDLVPAIYQTQSLMQQSVTQQIKIYNSGEQQKINNFFGIQSIERREDNMTIPQKRLLNSNGFSDQDLSGLSKKEASDLITKVKSGYWNPATEKQRALLRNKGFSNQEILFLSKDEASDLISQVLSSGKQGYSW